jgi:hypothetical protein
MRINLVKRLNSGSNPNNNATQNEKNKYPEDIGPGSFGKTANKGNNSRGPNYPDYEGYQPFCKYGHVAIITQQNP